MVRKIVLSLIAVFVFLAYATAQNRQISGTVSDANGHPVAGATVIVDGTSLGTTTNTAGEYTLSAPANGTLVVTFVGFEPAAAYRRKNPDQRHDEGGCASDRRRDRRGFRYG